MRSLSGRAPRSLNLDTDDEPIAVTWRARLVLSDDQPEVWPARSATRLVPTWMGV